MPQPTWPYRQIKVRLTRQVLGKGKPSFSTSVGRYIKLYEQKRDNSNLLEQDKRFELSPSVWKTDVLTADTNPAYLYSRSCSLTIFLMFDNRIERYFNYTTLTKRIT